MNYSSFARVGLVERLSHYLNAQNITALTTRIKIFKWKKPFNGGDVAEVDIIQKKDTAPLTKLYPFFNGTLKTLKTKF
jgi:hypothetical protein